MTIRSFIFLLLLLGLKVDFAYGEIPPEAKERLEIPKVMAIQNRPYSLKNELALHATYLPMDYFTTYLAAGGAYTTYFSDYFGWEVLNAGYASGSATGLESYVRNQGAVPEGLDTMTWYATSNLVYTPLYMKNLSLQEKVVWGDLSFVGGFGEANFKTVGNSGAVDLGATLRFFSTAHFAVKFDLRQYFYLAAGLKPNMGISLGFSYNFGGQENPAAQKEDD